MSEAYDPDNLLDRLSPRGHDGGALRAACAARGASCWPRGCGWTAATCSRWAAAGTRAATCSRSPAWRMTGVELERRQARRAGGGRRSRRRASPGRGGRARPLEPTAPSTSCSTGWCCTTSPTRARWPRCSRRRRALLRPGRRAGGGGAGRLAPGGGGPGAGQPRSAPGTAVHGTPDDIPLSPRRLVAEARAAGLEPELHAVTYTWRRMPPALQRALWPWTRALGDRPRAAPAAATR